MLGNYLVFLITSNFKNLKFTNKKAFTNSSFKKNSKISALISFMFFQILETIGKN
jgi:hypothetical protein